MLKKRLLGVAGVFLMLQQSGFSNAGPMALTGNASVSEMGAAIFQVPIDVPPGAGELEPRLQFHYNSQAANGILGNRWAISGLSSITRCPRTKAQDNFKGGVKFDANDRFCLDGERLMLVSGTYGAANAEYRTERDTFSKIVSLGTAGVGPASFKVWTKDGEIVEYGNTTDSRIEAQGKASARVWAVNRVSDIKGNYRTISYNEDTPNGYYYPNRIDYTGNTNTSQAPTSSVQFTYEDRLDQEVLYLAGSIVKPVKRLKKIVTANGASTVAEYQLSYGESVATNNSRLLSITKCGADAACLPPLNVGWSSGSATVPGAPTYSATQAFTNNLFFRTQWLSGDVDGDGQDDLVLVTVNNQYNILRNIWLADNDGSLGLTYTVEETGLDPHLWSEMQASLIDSNGDGRKDLVLNWVSGASGEVGNVVWLANSSGGYPTTYSSKSATAAFYPQVYSNKAFNYGDLNGDGRDDIVWSWRDGGNFGRAVWLADANGAYPGNASSVTPSEPGNSSLTGLPQHNLLGDVNGDGIPDLLVFWQEAPNVHKVVWLGQQDGTFPTTATTHEIEPGFGQPYNWYGASKVFLTDVNADGRMDITWAWNFSAGNMGPGRSVWVSKGDGTFGNKVVTTEEVIPDFAANFCNQRVQFISLDINGDNRSDLMLTCSYLNNQHFVTWITKPDGSLPETYTSKTLYTGYDLTLMTNSRAFLPADVNGDGKSDLLFAWADNSATLGRAVHQATAGLVDQVGSLNNGIGNTTSFTYKPMTDHYLYQFIVGAPPTVYPQKDVRLPLNLVDALAESNDIGGTMTTSYIYAGARSEHTGRGFLGFEMIQGTQLETGLFTQTIFRQDWPYLSLKKKVVKVSSDSIVLDGVENTFGCRNPANGSNCTIAAGQRYFPYVLQQVHAKSDLDGSVMPSTTTTWIYDNYGNPTSVSSVASDGYSKTITSTYLNDTSNWFIGRHTKSTTVGISP